MNTMTADLTPARPTKLLQESIFPPFSVNVPMPTKPSGPKVTKNPATTATPQVPVKK